MAFVTRIVRSLFCIRMWMSLAAYLICRRRVVARGQGLSALAKAEVVPATHSGEGLDVEVWYVMVAQDGAVEMTHALIKGGEFSEFIERIFVHDGSDFDALEEDDSSDDDAIDFDIKISRK